MKKIIILATVLLSSLGWILLVYYYFITIPNISREYCDYPNGKKRIVVMNKHFEMSSTGMTNNINIKDFETKIYLLKSKITENNSIFGKIAYIELPDGTLYESLQLLENDASLTQYSFSIEDCYTTQNNKR